MVSSLGRGLAVVVGSVLGVAMVPASVAAQVDPALSFSQPAVSPDGREIAFVSGGDIWVVPATGGVARLLVSHPAEDGRPLYSPDGRHLAFESERVGSDSDIHVLERATGRVRRLTYYDDSEALDAFSADGRYVYFTSARRDPGGLGDIYRVPVRGGTPEAVSADRYHAEYQAAPSRAGGVVALVSGGRMAQSQWWRNGSSHIDETGIWLMETPGGAGEEPTYSRVTEGGKNLWPIWSPLGDALIFMSDRTGTENLWTVTARGEAPTPLTEFTDGRVLWPSLAADGSLLAFERDFGIWTAPPGGEPTPLEIRLEGAVTESLTRRMTLDEDFGDLALSPDGKKAAFVVRGEVFAVGLEEGGAAVRVTRTPSAESEPAWDPDSRRLVYVSLRDGTPSLVVYDFGTGEERVITGTPDSDMTPRFSPDGSLIAYVRNGSQLRVVGVEADGEDRLVAEAQLWRHPFGGARPLAWSPDGEWIAFFATDRRMFTNAWAVPSAGGEQPRPLTGVANSFAGSLAWAPDGERFYMDSQHRTVTGQILEVDLVPRRPPFREDRFEALFEPGDLAGGEDAVASGSGNGDVAVRIDFQGIEQRVRPLSLGVDPGSLVLSPDGKTLVFTASAEGRTNLYAFSVDPEREGRPVSRQLTSTPGGKGDLHFTPDGREVVFLDGGRIRRVNVGSGEAQAVPVTAEMEVTVSDLRMAAFRQGWRLLADHFYDPGFHGTDWDAVRETFAPRVAGARSDGEMARLMNLMVGELDASHLGYRPPSGESGPSTGDLGVRFRAVGTGAAGAAGVPGGVAEAGVSRVEAAEGAALVVAEIIPLGPAALAGMVVGDVIHAVDGVALDSGTNLNRLLEARVQEKVRLELDRRGERLEVEVQPVSAGAVRELAYRAWVADRRAYVDRISGGRLGYVHMPSMGWGAYQQLLVDLDARNHAREGVVVDIRNNNGGFVNAYALDVFARRGYLTMETRGYPEANARSMLGQRALEMPTVLVVNQNTLSDGEDFTEGYRALELGPVVGEPTAGWIVFTWNQGLVDGASFRIPRSRIRGVMGDDMERAPRPVDLPVPRPLGESYSEHDVQLDVAVEALLRILDGR